MSQQQDRVQKTILRNLIHNEDYTRKVMPFLKDEYFIESASEKWIFREIHRYITKYNAPPTIEAVMIGLKPNRHISETLYQEITVYLNELGKRDKNDEQWLLNETEKFCRDTALYNATLQAITIMEGKEKVTQSKEEIPDLLKDALAVTFDRHIGHDYIDDADERYDFYHKQETRIPFNLSYFDKITKGGLPPKTLNMILAGTGVGKSLFMCHHAATCLTNGKNVLYITLEMAEERIAERIDANLLNVSLDDLMKLPKDMYEQKIGKLKRKRSIGKLIIKEYPTASAHAGNFRALMDELNLKLSFKPDILLIDYLNICASRRFKFSSSMTSYTYIKAIAEELRGLAVEYDIPILSATQTTRQGSRNSDVELTDTSESFGLPATADFMFAIITNENLDNLNQLMVKQLKNRYNDLIANRKFIIGIDRTKMRLYDVDASAQEDLSKADDDVYEDVEPTSKFQGFIV